MDIFNFIYFNFYFHLLFLNDILFLSYLISMFLSFNSIQTLFKHFKFLIYLYFILLNFFIINFKKKYYKIIFKKDINILKKFLNKKKNISKILLLFSIFLIIIAIDYDFVDLSSYFIFIFILFLLLNFSIFKKNITNPIPNDNDNDIIINIR